MRYFTSDEHFGHVNANALCGRPFASVEEADEMMIELWNAIVADDDIVICQGDLAMGPFLVSVAKTARLKGRKLLIPGNHDRVHPAYRQSDAKREQAHAAYRDAGWTVMDLQHTLELADGTDVDLCHFPHSGDSHGEDRYVEYRPVDTGRWLLHGHVHEKWKVNGRQLNVGVDAWNFRPVSEDEIINVIQSAK